MKELNCRMSFNKERKSNTKVNSVKSMHASKLEIYPNEFKEQESNNIELTLEYVQRLEDEIAQKDKEIKLIKEKLVKETKHNSPVNFL